MSKLLNARHHHVLYKDQHSLSSSMKFDNRPTLSRSAAVSVYNGFAEVDHTGGKDVGSGYGGPAISALLDMANFPRLSNNSPGANCNVVDYGVGQGKLAELVLSASSTDMHASSQQSCIRWTGIDQSPLMVEAARKRLQQYIGDANGTKDDREEENSSGGGIVSIELLESGNPTDIIPSIERHSVQRFVSTYCLDLLSEDDMYRVLDEAEYCLDPEEGLLLLAGITWGYKDSIKTCLMTLVWEILYIVARKKVGGCRPQHLEPYLKAKGWRIVEQRRTMPNGFPWMVSEVIAARPPLDLN